MIIWLQAYFLLIWNSQDTVFPLPYKMSVCLTFSKAAKKNTEELALLENWIYLQPKLAEY